MALLTSSPGEWSGRGLTSMSSPSWPASARMGRTAGPLLGIAAFTAAFTSV
jgi:hypothetical protein